MPRSPTWSTTCAATSATATRSASRPRTSPGCRILRPALRLRISTSGKITEQLGAAHDVAIDHVDDFQLVAVKLIRRGGATVLDHDDRETLVGEAAYG